MSTEESTAAGALAAALRADPNRPLLTYYDESLGERTELSAVTLDNWVAKTANMLVDGAGLGPDDTAGVLLPAHWQTAAVLLGCFAAGVPVRTVPEADAAPVDVAFGTPGRLAELRDLRPAETYLLGLRPMAAPLAEVPPGAADFVVEVRQYGDRFVPAPVDPDAPALLGPAPVSQAELMARARRHAGESGLLPGGRLLVPVDGEPDPMAWLLAPLAIGASVVLCRNADEARIDAIAAAERTTSRT
ncbi:TIGR03089 family protein [Actinocatenispora rupis]|uniref:Acyl-CoA synthetase n=1 Tax=Actinocatenispora rupis TaxID=519421 RepID=A0A8J3JBU6_9ACTN|nr:TIGR03089 family protein [Actinocatenispora rupis]GID11943.1 acyl-CoA synthetase [Actinocatenispora rupis]